MSRIKTNENFKKLLPFSGDAIAVPAIVDAGLIHHLVIKMPSGGRIILSVPEDIYKRYPEYFSDEN